MKKIFGVILLSLPFFLLLVLPFVIKVTKIECYTQYGSCPEELNLGVESLESEDLRTAKKGIKKILKESNFITDSSIQFKLPSILKVEVLIKKPFYAINQKDTTNFALVDREGIVLGISDSSSLPKAIIKDRVKNVGERVSEKELEALELIDGVFSMYQIDTGEIQGESLAVALPGGVNVIFPLDNGNRDVLLGTLRLIYTKIQSEESNKFREIDLRFVNPVLR